VGKLNLKVFAGFLYTEHHLNYPLRGSLFFLFTSKRVGRKEIPDEEAEEELLDGVVEKEAEE